MSYIYEIGTTQQIDKMRPRLNRNHILDMIRENKEISLKDLTKIIGCDYAGLWRIIHAFEFAGLVKTEILIDKNNREQKIIRIT